MTPLPLPLLLLAGGCAPTVSYQDVRVSHATLQDADTSSVAVIGGYVGGDALLVFSGPGGVSGAMPVALRGGRAGLALDINLDLNPGSDIPLDLSDAGGTVWLSEILGRYRGLGWALSAGAGGSGRSLKNSAGVRIKDKHFSLGGGAFVGMEWLTIRIGGHEDDINDIGFQWPIDTGYADDTGFYDTGWSTPVDSGYPAVSRGCGASSSSSSSHDTGYAASSGGCSGGSTSADSGFEDTGSSSSSGGCGSSSSSDSAASSDDDEDEDDTGSSSSGGGGCGSSSSDTSTAFYGALIVSIVGLRRRKDRS